MSAKPLNVPSTGSKPSTPSPASKVTSKPTAPVSATPKTPMTTKAEDISSPHELTAYVESLLSQLETRFEDMSSQVLDKMIQMSSRVDTLESSIQDLINDTHVPSTPQPPQPQHSSVATPLEKVDE